MVQVTDSLPTEIRRDRSPAAIKVDNLLRRRLRISNPGDPIEVASALRRLYPRDSHALEREASGLPLPTLPVIPVPRSDDAASGTEFAQATGDIERDLATLANDSQLKDIDVELRGWAQALRTIVAEGAAAARLALDPRARDRAMAARRQLADYARMARLIGAMTCSHNLAYRKLAQSLDEAASLLLVLMGEALARIGFGGGRFLLQAPASELQARRDAVILALRNLTGTAQETYGSKDWPYGLHGLRQIIRQLDDSGHADLRALLEENTIATAMDQLLDQASAAGADGLRVLGATAQVTVQRLNRLVEVLAGQGLPESPPLYAFLEAIRLFSDGFQGSSSGYRLLFIARPPVVFYGLYGIGGPDPATGRLINLVILRGRLAQLLDCYLGCNCCGEPVICQALLDKLLYDTDHAIDLYALGAEPLGNGEPERRAAAYGHLIAAFLSLDEGQRQAYLKQLCLPSLEDLRPTLEGVRDQLLAIQPVSQADRKLMRNELCLQRRMDARWGGLLATMAPGCVRGADVLGRIDGLLGFAIDRLDLPGDSTCPDPALTPPPTVETSLEIFDALGNLLGKSRS